MKICSFLILLILSFTCCRSLIRTVPVNSDGNPGIISLKNVALSVESTICMEVRIKQFYQATSYRDQKGYVHPDQFILASEGYGYLKAVPAFDCNDFYPGCEAVGKSVIGEQWNNEEENQKSSQKLTGIFTPSLNSHNAQKLLLKAVFLNIYSKGLRYWGVCRKSLK